MHVGLVMHAKSICSRKGNKMIDNSEDRIDGILLRSTVGTVINVRLSEPSPISYYQFPQLLTYQIYSSSMTSFSTCMKSLHCSVN
jgi:hypothetical protein